MVYVDLASRSASNFLSLSAKPFPHSEQTSLLSANDKTHPYFMSLSGKRFRKHKDLPFFSPEEVSYVTKEAGDITLWQVSRPPMQRPVNAGRKPVAFTTKAEREARQKADMTPPEAPSPFQMGTALEAKPTLSQEDRRLLDQASKIASLRAAVRTINDMVNELGDDINVEYNAETGHIRVFVSVDAN